MESLTVIDFLLAHEHRYLQKSSSGRDCRDPEAMDGEVNSEHKSSHFGFWCSIKRIFAIRDHFLSCFSRKIALSIIS